MLLGVVGTFYLLEIIEKKSSLQYIVVSVASICSSYFLGFLLFAHAIYLLSQIGWKTTVRIFFFVSLFSVPIMPTLVTQFSRVNSGFWIAKPSIDATVQIFLSMLGGGKLMIIVLPLIGLALYKGRDH